MTESVHRYRVQPLDIEGHPARVLQETSFEAAAVAFAEDFGAGMEHDAVRLVVRDLDSGHEHCFRVDLDTDAASPCA